MGNIKNLAPTEVWEQFDKICKIPRPSKREEKMIAYLLDFGKQHSLATFRDKIGNVVIKKAATTGFENRPTIVLQSHIDMVCEKSAESTHNFDTDAIETIIDGKWVTANNTTLGADDGIGVATQLAILASTNIQHPSLECLFTVDEETGLTGASALDTNLISGRILINLDSEDEGEIFIGCAGGIGTTAKFEYQMQQIAEENISAYRIEVKGLRGGHSGDDINKGFGNANKIISRILWNATKQFGIHLCKIGGGNLHNAIPRDAFAEIVISQPNIKEFMTSFDKLKTCIMQEFKYTEPNIEIDISQIPTPKETIAETDQKRILNAIYGCPNGVIAMSQFIKSLVETSTNLASIKMVDNNTIIIGTSQRSSIESSKYDIANMVECVFEQAGAIVEHTEGYPGWEPNIDSNILDVAIRSYNRLFKKAPTVKAIHAGLECGLFLEKIPDMDMISIGPTLRGVHSPSERIEIKSVGLFFDFLIDILKNCK